MELQGTRYNVFHFYCHYRPKLREKTASQDAPTARTKIQVKFRPIRGKSNGARTRSRQVQQIGWSPPQKTKTSIRTGRPLWTRKGHRSHVWSADWYSYGQWKCSYTKIWTTARTSSGRLFSATKIKWPRRFRSSQRALTYISSYTSFTEQTASRS